MLAQVMLRLLGATNRRPGIVAHFAVRGARCRMVLLVERLVGEICYRALAPPVAEDGAEDFTRYRLMMYHSTVIGFFPRCCHLR